MDKPIPTDIPQDMRRAPTATEEPHLERLRRLIEEAYREHPTGTGGSFGEILCHEIHENGMTFIWLAQKWGVSLPTLGELIWDHCKKLEKEPLVRHGYNPDEKAASRFEEMQKRIAPFVRPRTFRQPSSAGRWRRGEDLL